MTNTKGGWAAVLTDDTNFLSRVQIVGNFRRDFSGSETFVEVGGFPENLNAFFDISNPAGKDAAGKVAWIRERDFIGRAALVDDQLILSAGDPVGDSSDVVGEITDVTLSEEAKTSVVFVVANETENRYVEQVTLPGMSRKTLLQPGDTIDGIAIAPSPDDQVYLSPNGKRWLTQAVDEATGQVEMIENTGKLQRLGGAIVREGDPVPESLGLQIPGRSAVFMNEKPVFQEGVTCFDSPNTNCDLFLFGEVEATSVNINNAGDWWMSLGFTNSTGDSLIFQIVNGMPIVGPGTDLDLDGDGSLDAGVANTGSRSALSERFKDGTVDLITNPSLCEVGDYTCSSGAVLIAFTLEVEKGSKKGVDGEVPGKDDPLFKFDVSSLGDGLSDWNLENVFKG
uniref:Uncharacterized protein n=1 Tax=Chromera velia CCMP2878 TaxID=1169474 RepID=A0A0G4F365_9ALVE|eukprot:Cvel_14889.t1-p1 / transcript=Cvel_14889.t1 / gene=Cvel_14889 / organism=Chromera_velia_CCMP2878 / gene_product=hypothetical protein / transcript_product=hypothetical protein / location=Cvel_scaffold1077:38816-42572(+) / protein_length=395 / sequence_SO=supercontig / SO=protein_coding / is_pseudo=false